MVLAEACRRMVETGSPLPGFQADDGGDVQELPRDGAPEWLLRELLEGSAVAVTFRHADAARWNQQARRSAERPPDSPVAGDRLVTVQASYGRGLLNGEELRVVEVAGERRISIRDESVELQDLVLQYDDPASTQFQAWVVKDLLHSAPATEMKRVSRVLWRDFVRRAEGQQIKRNTEPFFELLEVDPFANALRCMYSYARTCHRAQGGEWDHAICDLGGTKMLGRGRGRFGYTAITRARTSAWLREWPRSTTSREERLAEFVDAATQIVRCVTQPVEAVPMNARSPYVSLRRHSTDRELVVNLYPTLKCHVDRVPAGVDAVALKAQLDAWAAARRALDAEPPDPCLEPTLLVLQAHADRRGMDLDATRAADNQVLLTLSTDRRQARLRMHHRSSGELTEEIASGTGGDADLLTTLRTMVAETRVQP
jgi:hypothetical protein